MNSPVILITGAGKGIGKAVVEKICARSKVLGNPRLVLTSRTRSDLEALETLVKKSGLPCEILAQDLSDHPTGPVQFALEKFSRIDQVIHCAGVGRFGPFLELTAEDLEYTFKTNVEASFLFLQSAYDALKKQGPRDPARHPLHRGDLVWITSVAAEKPFELSAVYCMSKYAQRGLIDVMRLYGRKDGIRIIDIKPGATLTPMWGELSESVAKKMMSPEDIAEIILDAILLHPRSTVEELVIRPIFGDL